jgi:deoxyribonuclease IV
MSIAGGIDKAPLRGKEVGCEVIQIFTSSNRQWHTRTPGDDEVRRFHENCAKTGIWSVYAHNCYLINLGASDTALRRKSIRTFAEELDRCEKIGIPWVIAHPGLHTGAGERAGLDRIANALNVLLDGARGYKVGILLETTSGQGSSLGYCFEHLARLIESVHETARVGVCYDTCHTFTAGYDIRSGAAYERTFEEFNRILGIARLKAFHFNDSVGDFNSRLDRHEHIGKGKLGSRAFQLILRDKRFRDVPKFLETPKGLKGKRDWDAISLSLLRRLVTAR